MENANRGRLMIRVIAHSSYRESPVSYKELSNDSAREAFWRSLSSQSERMPSPEECEARIRRRFGTHLKRHLTNYCRESWGAIQPESSNHSTSGNELERRAAELACVFFEADIEGYSSLNLGIDIAGAKELAGILGGNFDVFMMFASAYIPRAFADALDDSIPEQAVDFEIKASGATREAFAGVNNATSGQFQQQPTPGPPQGGATKGRVAILGKQIDFIWAVSNFSLLPLVLLTLLVCYVAYQGLAEERKLLTDRYEQIFKQHQSMMTQYEKWIAEQAKLESALVQRLVGDLAKQKQGDNLANAPRP